MHEINVDTTVEPVYYGQLVTSKECPDYQGVLIFQVVLYEKVPFGTSTKCQVSLFLSVQINRFHCITKAACFPKC